MGENLLIEGSPRMGWFIDGNPDTPEVAVMLQDTGRQIVLTVPTSGMIGKDPYSRWFSFGIRFGDDPDRTRYSYEPPRVTMFYDKDGPVVLVGCHAVGMTSGLEAGSGRIVANFAVLGGRNLRYDKINGVRSELPALARWAGQRSVHTEPETDGQGRVQRVRVTLDSPPEIPLNRRMNLTLRPTWRTSYPDRVGTFAAHDVVQLETRSTRHATWDEHLQQHAAVRDLLVLAGWRSFGFSRLEVNRTDDPTRVLSGEPVGPRWAGVVTHRLRKHEDWARHPEFLFTLDDIGTTGVRRWMQLRLHFARAMQPLVGIADQKDAFWETRMVQSGIALEALGYQIEIDNGGTNLDGRGQLSHQKALDAILTDMNYVPLNDTADWKERSRACYMGVKHADNRVPDSLVLANTLRENLLILRFWLAGRLGCTESFLKDRLGFDPLANEYVLVE